MASLVQKANRGYRDRKEFRGLMANQETRENRGPTVNPGRKVNRVFRQKANQGHRGQMEFQGQRVNRAFHQKETRENLVRMASQERSRRHW